MSESWGDFEPPNRVEKPSKSSCIYSSGTPAISSNSNINSSMKQTNILGFFIPKPTTTATTTISRRRHIEEEEEEEEEDEENGGDEETPSFDPLIIERFEIRVGLTLSHI